MKSVLPFLVLLIVFASCTTAYKTGQTPDDVYYSPSRPQEEYVRVERNNDQQYRSNSRYDDDYYNDRYLRMKIRNRQMWSDLDYYYSDPYAYRYYNPYNRYNRFYYNDIFWNPYSSWNYYYNPYYYPYGSQVIIVNPKNPVYNKPRTSNLHVFDSPELNSTNPKQTFGRNRTFNNSDYNSESIYRAPRRDNGSDLRSIFGSSDNSSSRSVDNSSSRSSGSSSSSSGSSGSSGGNAPVRRF